MVGASRRRAAPRNQSSGAAHVSPCHFIDWRRPLKLQNCSELHQSRVPEKKFQLCFIPVSFGVKQIKRCGLTRRNRPVSLYVRPQKLSAAHPMIYFRPIPIHRKNVRGVLMPLTAAIFRVFGNRAQDNGRPIGAFYPSNISASTWDRIGGIWYKAKDENKVRDRAVNLDTVEIFARCILSGQSCLLPNGMRITWERIPSDQAIQLPPPIAHSALG